MSIAMKQVILMQVAECTFLGLLETLIIKLGVKNNFCIFTVSSYSHAIII